MNNAHYTREEVEGMLPDYVFGRLTDAETRIFEETIEFFPELRSEIDDARALFEKIENMDFPAEIDQRTRNLSVKVNERLQRETDRPTAISWIRRLAPVMVLSTVILVFYYQLVHKGAEDQSFDEQLARILDKDPGTAQLAQSGLEANVLPLSLVPHDLNAVSLVPDQDGEQIEGLLAESIVGASTADADQLLPDEQSNEALDLLNSVDIQEVEQQIHEVENGEG